MVFKNGHYNFSQPFVHVAFVPILVFKTFDQVVFGRLSLPGTRWKYGTQKWYVIR